MRILLTGSSGFLGGHLCTMLHDQGHELTCSGREPIIPSPQERNIVVPDIAVYDCGTKYWQILTW